MTEANPKYQIPESVVFQDLDGETVLLDLEGESYFGLDEVGSEIWNLLSEGLAPAEITERLSTRYRATREEISRDVDEFLQRLIAHGLLEKAG